jgi:predicted negative regulator of RcsB-dependent stress response|tara:strand:- start:124 stop:864 length:741 start_codon:yes stop_codon:yes gene_type:complete
MDHDRLKDIQTADLSESNVNEDFVHWLKTKGPSYLLVVMVVIVGYLFYIRYQSSQTQHQGEAWIAFAEARVSGLPASFEDIATTYSDIGSLRPLGLLNAADGYLKAVVLNQALGSDANVTTTLSEEDRTFYLQKADALYAEVVTSDDNQKANTLFAAGGLSGRAAIAEANGDIEGARNYYEAVIVRVGDQYPALATQAQSRIASLDLLTEPILLPTETAVTARNSQIIKRDPKAVDNDISAIVTPE